VATFFSRYYLTGTWNPHDIFVACLAHTQRLFDGGSATATMAAFPPMTFPRLPAAWSVMLTCVLWLASWTLGLCCVVVSALLREWVSRHAAEERPLYGLVSPSLLGAFFMRHCDPWQGSPRTTLRILREWLLVAILSFISGLDIRILNTANSPSPLVVFGLSAMYFTGQCLILAAWPRSPSSEAEIIPV